MFQTVYCVCDKWGALKYWVQAVALPRLLGLGGGPGPQVTYQNSIMEIIRISGTKIKEERKKCLDRNYWMRFTRGLCSAVGQYGLMMMNVFLTHCPTLNNILQKNTKAAADTEYPAYGVTGPNKGDNTSPSGDRKLAQSAQMYHYQHQKQQMIALEKAGTDRNQSASDVDSEEENEEGDYTVYECPGLAPTGEMEVKNPLFNEQPTPTSPSLKKSNYNENETLPEKESTKM
ncbi:Neural proliferation differentiation and control protein 1 [Nymphon striatum]|nr:Neural proliferation differentiation and control protein 1 [Nymphon striatum]